MCFALLSFRPVASCLKNSA
uniref:Uncharacterized protein n=1 Tax=Rhizophora mucronata TaxID=61149 RepID=A0A2P2PMK3_RHIMU